MGDDDDALYLLVGSVVKDAFSAAARHVVFDDGWYRPSR